MSSPIYISIVLGSPPSRKHPIQYAQLQTLAKRRIDVELRVAQTGTKEKKDTLLVDPSGKIKGELLFIDGRLQIRNPKNETISWMIELANDLGGRVVDNRLRTYKNVNETYFHPDDNEARLRLRKSVSEASQLAHKPDNQGFFSVFCRTLNNLKSLYAKRRHTKSR